MGQAGANHLIGKLGELRMWIGPNLIPALRIQHRNLSIAAVASPRLLCAALLTASLFASTALGQSASTISGMKAYNAGDFSTAFRLLSGAAKEGDPEAQVNLGYLYARGHGARADQVEALRLYRLSAAQGDGEGMNAIGYKYEFASGVPKDVEQAVHWFCRAIEHGNPRAMNNLANMLSAGSDIRRNLPEARRLWEQAAALGHVNAAYNMGLSYLQGLSGENDAHLAGVWILKAGKAGQADAQRILRRNGYAGPLPPSVDYQLGMFPAPQGAAGHSEICAVVTS
jgi:TPR repeat protein